MARSYAEHEVLLLNRRDALREKLNAIKADARRGLDPDTEERAFELQNADVLNEIARVTEEELGRVEADLRRLASVRKAF